MDFTKYWDISKNKINATSFKNKSNKKFWFKCNKAEDHEWHSAISKVTELTDCPFCIGKRTCLSNSFAATHPELAKEWHHRNDKFPIDVRYGSGYNAWWQCKKGHEWQTTVNSRINQNSSCPYCCNQKISFENSIKKTHPNLCKEWSNKNKFSATELSSGSNIKIWWQCKKGHEWLASPNNRSNGKGRGCPYCANKIVDENNCLVTTHPELICEWSDHNSIKPEQITAGSGKKIHWVCQKNNNHKWIAALCDRTGLRKNCCPFCNESKGEKLIVDILDLLKCDYKRQFKLDTCRNKLALPFDFGLLKDGVLKGLIEYHGIQHYKPVSFFGGEDSFKKTRKNDLIKKKFCDINKIPLLTLSFRVKSIQDKINYFLKEIDA